MITDGSSADHAGLSVEPAEEHSRRLRINGPGGRLTRDAASGSVQRNRLEEAGMATRDRRRGGWTVVLRRQPAHMGLYQAPGPQGPVPGG